MKIFGNKPTLSAWFGLTVVFIFVFVSIFTPWLAPYGQSANIGGTWDEPSAKMLLGADQIGNVVERDDGLVVTDRDPRSAASVRGVRRAGGREGPH